MMARTSPNPSKSPVSFEGAEKEEPIEVVPENTAFTVEDRLLDVSRMERAPIQGYLLNGSASDQAPSKEGMAKGDGDESSMPNQDTHNDAGREEPPLPVSCFPEERDGPLEGMPPMQGDGAFYKLQGRGDALLPDDANIAGVSFFLDFLPDVYAYMNAGKEQLPVAISSLAEERNGLMEGMAPVHGDPTFCKLEGRGNALPDDASLPEAPPFHDSEAAAHMQMNYEVLDAAFNFFKVPGKPDAAESTERPTTVKGAGGVVCPCLPSELEEIKQMSFDELLARIAEENKIISRHTKIHQEVGGILTECLQNYGGILMEAFEAGPHRRLHDP
ncbi:hypothetical protein COCOBI_13-2870 [Coccomyxa sp. Obi]|nr:hypothetical protein COCOBI_13-2870 [Coccomyxa sp. Obi]